MTKILIDKETVEMVAELLAVATFYSPALQEKRIVVFDTVLKALKQSTEQEPVAWRRQHEGDVSDLCQWLYADEYETKDDSPNWQPLYTQPQEAAPSKQLTDEMVTLGAKALAKRHADSCGLDFDDVWKYYADEHKDDARVALTAAHGITGEKE